MRITLRDLLKELTAIASVGVLSTGCTLIPAVPSVPKVTSQVPAEAEKLSASVAVILLPYFKDAEFFEPDYTPKNSRAFWGDVRVKIGESTVHLLELTLHRIFESVSFEGSRDQVREADLVLVPKMKWSGRGNRDDWSDENPSRQPNLSASIEYEFLFHYRDGRTQLFQVAGESMYEPELSFGEHLGEFFGILLGLPGINPGSFGARWTARAFAEAQEAAFRDFVAELYSSKLALEFRKQ